MGLAEPRRMRQIALELCDDVFNTAGELLVGGQGFELRGLERGQEAQRVALTVDPGFGIDLVQGANRLFIPASPEIVREFPQWR